MAKVAYPPDATVADLKRPCNYRATRTAGPTTTLPLSFQRVCYFA
jgi:hypothetical protein